jgi:hypothetical protein
MATSLIEYLRGIPDVRSDLGKRYQLDDLLVMIILGMMSGCYGYRELGTFVRANREELVALLGLKRNAVPSYVTFRAVMLDLDFVALNASFTQWACERLEIAPGDLFSIDGKALASTISDEHGPKQTFICFLSVFSQRQHIVQSVTRYTHGHLSEIPALCTLIETLGLRGVTLSVDAMHCQKKRSGRSETPAMITS